LELEERPHISVIRSIEVLVGCGESECGRVAVWLQTIARMPFDDAIAMELVRLRRQHQAMPLQLNHVERQHWNQFTHCPGHSTLSFTPGKGTPPTAQILVLYL
jgi:hypothetical protein